MNNLNKNCLWKGHAEGMPTIGLETGLHHTNVKQLPFDLSFHHCFQVTTHQCLCKVHDFHVILVSHIIKMVEVNKSECGMSSLYLFTVSLWYTYIWYVVQNPSLQIFHWYLTKAMVCLPSSCPWSKIMRNVFGHDKPVLETVPV